MPAATRPIHHTNAEIVVASRREPGRFAEILDRHTAGIRGYCISRVGAAGKDVAAETFRVALGSCRRFGGSREDAGPWLFGIATNLLRRSLRLETRRTRALLRVHMRSEADLVDGALDRVEAEALGPTLAEALGLLTPVYRDALLLLHVWGDLSYEQALSTLRGVTQTTTRIHGIHTLKVTFPDDEYADRIWLDASTGVPIQEQDGNNSATAFVVKRVIAARLPPHVSPKARLRVIVSETLTLDGRAARQAHRPLRPPTVPALPRPSPNTRPSVGHYGFCGA